MENKTFQVITRTGKVCWYVVRQVPGIDKIYKLGDRIPCLGRIIFIKD